MRILIDECLNWRLCRGLPGHNAVSVKKMGWSGVKNGQLLARMRADGFEVLVTGDQSIAHQQNAKQFNIAIVVLEAESTKLLHTMPLMPKVAAALPFLQAGQVITIKP